MGKKLHCSSSIRWKLTGVLHAGRFLFAALIGYLSIALIYMNLVGAKLPLGLVPAEKALSILGFSHAGWSTFVGGSRDIYTVRLKLEFDPSAEVANFHQILVPYRQGPIRNIRAYFFRNAHYWSLNGYVRQGMLRYFCREEHNQSRPRRVSFEEGTLPMEQFQVQNGELSIIKFHALSIYDCDRDTYIPVGEN